MVNVKGELTLVHLYPRDMNIYGDAGNVRSLQRRVNAHGYTARVVTVDQGEPLPAQADIVVAGGGQDSGQERVHTDLLHRANQLRDLASAGTPMLMICGMYQLFGHWFRTHTGTEIEGIGVLDVTTTAQSQRLIGNTVVRSESFGEVIGYENHSGQTFLGELASPLGEVVLGEGNNTVDRTEGARVHNVIGSYLHGSLLPKNPAISDFLVERAAIRRFGEFTPATIDDALVEKARQSALSRPR